MFNLHLMYSTPTNKIKNFIDLDLFLNNKKAGKYVLVMDSNLCIFIEEYFNNPSRTVENWKANGNYELLTDFFEMIKTIRKYELEYNIYSALNENCRNVFSDYTIILGKFVERVDKVECILEDFPLEKVLYPRNSFKSPTNIEDMKNLMKPIIKKYDVPEKPRNLVLSYVYTLKIKQLLSDRNKTNSERLVEFYRFMVEKVDIISLAHWGTAVLCFGDLKLKSGKAIVKLIHTKKKKRLSKKESFLQGIWNAAIDLNWVIEVSREFGDNKSPIFVTNDEALNEVMKRYLINVLVKKNDGGLSVIAEFDFSKVNFDKTYKKTFEQLNSKIHYKQKDLNRSLKLRKGLSDGSLEKELFKIKDDLETVVLYELENVFNN